MRLVRIFVLGILVAVACTTDNPYQLKLKPFELVGSDFPLPSGLRVFFQEDHNQPSVIVTSVVGVGATGDPQGMEGMAHLVEHLNFKALHNGKPKVWDQIKALGGVFNAYTSTDNTTYYTVGPKDELKALLEIEVLRMLDAVEGVTDQVLEVERDVVRNELRQSNETTIDSKAYEALNKALFPVGHPYHRSVIGTHESLLNITMDDVRAFVKKYYRPSNFTMVIAGDFDRAQAGTILSQTFPKQVLAAPGQEDATLKLVEPQPRIQGEAQEPPPPADQSVQHLESLVTNPTVLLAWSLPGMYRGQDWLMETTIGTLTSAVGSLLFPEDYYERGGITEIGCFPILRPLATMALCQIEVTTGDDPEEIAKKAIDGVWETWDQATRTWRDRYLAAAATSGMASLFRSSASLWRASQVAETLHYTGQPDYFARSFTEAGQLNELKARQFAFKYLGRDRVVTVIMEPYKNEQDIPKVTFDPTSSYTGAVLDDDTAIFNQRFATLTPEHLAAVAIAPDMKRFRELTLDNGLQVVLKQHGAAPFIQIGALMRGGNYTSRPLGLPSFEVVDARNQPALKIAGVTYGGALEDVYRWWLEAPSGNLEAALDILADRIETSFSDFDDEFHKYIVGRYETIIGIQERRPEIWAERGVYELLLPGHPLSHRVFDIAKLEALTKKNYSTWLNKTRAPANTTLVVVGDMDLDQAEQLVRARWSDWRKKNPGVPLPGLPPPPPPPSPVILLLDRPDATQSELKLGCPLEPKTAGRDAVHSVATGLLAEDLWRTIRERTGSSYGVYPYGLDYEGGTSLLFVEGTVQSDAAVASIKTIRDRIRELSEGKVDSGQLNRTKWDLARGTHTKNLDIGDMVNNIIAKKRLGHPIGSFGTLPVRLAKVQAHDVAKVYGPCTGHEIIAVIGPASSIKEPLQSLGVPVRTIDWQQSAKLEKEKAKKD